MFGLGFPQLVLILAGICFMVAGVYGLAPSLVTSRFGAGAGESTPVKEPKLSKKQLKAKARAEALKAVQLKPQPQQQVTKETSPAMKAEAPAPKVEAVLVPAAKPATVAEVKPAAVAAVPAAKVEAAPVVAMAKPETEEHETVMMDQELVEELFSEMFALRSTVAGLASEVHQLRTEQRSRRFIVEEVVA